MSFKHLKCFERKYFDNNRFIVNLINVVELQKYFDKNKKNSLSKMTKKTMIYSDDC